MNKVIELNSIEVKYGEKIALSEIDLEIYQGEFVGIIGPNGSGKSTLLKLILGLLKPSSGKISVLGKSYLKGIARNQIGYIPQYQQQDVHFPIKVFDVVMMGRISKLGIFHRPKKADKEAVFSALDKVGMLDYYQTPFGHLSSGQQQRIAFARVLAQGAQIFLLDEPTTGIDLALQHELLSLIGQLHQTEKITILYVAHEINILSRYLNKIVCLNTKLHQVGLPKDILTSQVLSSLFQRDVDVFTHQDYSFFIVGGEIDK